MGYKGGEREGAFPDTLPSYEDCVNFSSVVRREESVCVCTLSTVMRKEMLQFLFEFVRELFFLHPLACERKASHVSFVVFVEIILVRGVFEDRL